jgi:starvation-inducible outer membrane lipoprotein
MKILRKVCVKLVGLLLAVIWLTGCGPSISQQLQERNVRPIPFDQLVKDPQRYQGREVILGGYVLQTVDGSATRRLSILQAPLDRVTFEPRMRNLSEGQFLLWSKEPLAPDGYSRGRSVTVLGRVSGPSEQSGTDDLLIQAERIHLWPKPITAYRSASRYGRK